MFLAHVSRLLRTAKAIILQEGGNAHSRDRPDERGSPNQGCETGAGGCANNATGGDEEDDDGCGGWDWRDECLRVFAAANAQDNDVCINHERRNQSRRSSLNADAKEDSAIATGGGSPCDTVHTFVDCWAPLDAVRRCRDAHAKASLLSGAEGIDNENRIEMGQHRGGLEEHLARLELMATLLQLHIEGEVVPDFIDSLSHMQPLTLENAIAHARVTSCLITGKRKSIKVLKRTIVPG